MTYFDIVTGYNETATDTEDILLIPLDRAITKDYSLRDRELLYSRGLHFVFNSVQYVKVRWYQQEWFRIFVIVVSFIFGDLGLVDFIIQLIITEIVIRLAIKFLGPELALLVAIVMAFKAGFDWAKATNAKGIATAKEFLTLASGIAKASINQYFKEQFNDLLDEYKKFEALKTEQDKELERANDLLGNSIRLDPFIIFGEKPEDFYNRTIHAGNIGVRALDTVSNYVTVALTLPTATESYGEPGYV